MIINTATLVFILSLAIMTTAQGPGQVIRPILSPSNSVPQNPLSLIFVSESSDITIRFGLSFLEEIRLLKKSCRSQAASMERLFKEQIEQMVQYQQQTTDVLESSGMSDMDQEEKQDMLSSVRMAMKHLLEEQKNKSRELKDNCTRRLNELYDSRLYSALSYGKSILNKGNSIGAYIGFVNHVTKYSKNLQHALDDCIDVYSTVFINHRYGTSYEGSTTEVCMIEEVQALIEFVNEFIIEATKLLKKYQTSGGIDPSPSPPAIIQIPVQNKTDNSSKDHHGGHHGHHGNHGGHHGHHGNHGGHHGHHGHHGNHHHGNHNGSHHGHHGNGGHHGHHGNHNGGHHGHHGNGGHHGHHGNHNGGHHGHHGNGGHHGNHNGNHHNDHSGSHHNNHPNHVSPSRDHFRPHPTSRSEPRPTPVIDIIVDPPITDTDTIKGKEHTPNNRMMTILVITSAISAVLVLAIILVGIAIMMVRSNKKKKESKGVATKGGPWTKLSEEEKVSQMKQSGYINPTYKFFDRVTQQ